jgi:pyruvate dehydrogenase E1 component alpha subunit
MEKLKKQDSLFKEFGPLTYKMFQVMDDNGKIIKPGWKPEISDREILNAYKFMQFARTADIMTVSYQRQGRMHTYPPNLGQEAIAAAAGFIMRKQDWLVPAFREMGAWLLKGAALKDLFLYWGGHEDGLMFPGAENFLPISVPIASQLPHAVGIGYALKYKKKDGVVFAFVGDGGTSQGDFHEALNFAGVWNVPVVFIIQNNQYAISVPVKKQTASKNLAVKAVAYGIDGIQADGNDYFAVYAAISEAAKHAGSGKGPVLIEAVTFRRGAHTTSDDPTLYRTEAEEKKWEKKDPIKRLRDYLISKKLWKTKDDEPLIAQYKKEVEAQFSQYENYPAYKLEDVFKYQYVEMPDDLKKQQVEYEKFLNLQEARK